MITNGESPVNAFFQKIGIGVITYPLIIFFVWLPMSFLYAWSIKWLLIWFAVPHGFPELTLAEIIGLRMAIGIVIVRNEIKKEFENNEPKVLLTLVARPLVALILGYIIHKVF